ncbi:hypothetical protein BLOT_016746, partial [Blomia tropicalis]
MAMAMAVAVCLLMDDTKRLTIPKDGRCQTMANHVPNNGRSRTKRLKIKGTKTMETHESNDGPNGTKRWTIKYQTSNFLDGRSSTKRLTIPNDGTNGELPNDGQSRTKRWTIKDQTIKD